jgi:hypothetical protein
MVIAYLHNKQVAKIGFGKLAQVMMRIVQIKLLGSKAISIMQLKD